MANEKRLIDANATKTIIQKGMNKSDFQLFKDVMQCVCNILDYSDTVDAVEVVHGRWIEKQEPITWCEDDVEVFWECSICGCLNFGESNYCPDCGARMDGDEDDNDT